MAQPALYMKDIPGYYAFKRWRHVGTVMMHLRWFCREQERGMAGLGQCWRRSLGMLRILDIRNCVSISTDWEVLKWRVKFKLSTTIGLDSAKGSGVRRVMYITIHHDIETLFISITYHAAAAFALVAAASE